MSHPAASPPPETMDVLRLLWRVDHALGTLSRQMLACLGVTSPQRVALRTLVRDPTTTAASLASALRVDRSSVTGILRRLEEASCIERSPDREDGRRRRIRVTEKGTRLDALQRGTVEAAMGRALSALAQGEAEVVACFLASFAMELERERDVLLTLPAGR